MKSFFVIIPCYNEGGRVLSTIDQVRRYCTAPVVVVNDGSTDLTPGLLIDCAKCELVSLWPNRGKAAALLAGCDYAFGEGAEAVVVLDADGQHDPVLIPEFVEKLGGCDVVLGVRPRDERMPFNRRVGNFVITKALRLLFGLKVSDALSGYKAFTKEAFVKMRWNERGRYLVESDMLINMAKSDLSFCEITIPTVYVNKGGITKRDGLRIFWNIVKRRFVG